VHDVTTHSARILIADDLEDNVSVLTRILSRHGYEHIRATTDSSTVVDLFVDFEPDIVLLDLHMPGLDGVAVIERLNALITPGTYLPILVLTGDTSAEAKRRTLTAGAKDFLNKPFDISEALLRIGNLLETRRLHVELARTNSTLERKVIARTRQLEASQIEILERLAAAVEFRDDDTGQHTRRVGHIAAELARARGLSLSEQALVRRAAPLHDVGKVAVPDSILLKPDRLTPEERRVMQRHAATGARILARGRSPLLRMAEQIAMSHHERWDGSGYPHGLAGVAIPIAARLTSVADVFDALSHDRPYRRAWERERVLAEIERESGVGLDPKIVAACLRSAIHARFVMPDDEAKQASA
jgi:putative two-component system response regulator